MTGPEGPRVSFVLIRSKFVMFTAVIYSTHGHTKIAFNCSSLLFTCNYTKCV